MRWCGVALAVCLLCFGSTNVAAQNWTITGQAQSAPGTGLADVDLDLHPQGSPEFVPLLGDLSDPAGFFTTTIDAVIPPGLYDVRLEPPSGFLPVLIEGISVTGDLDIGMVQVPTGWVLEGQVVDAFGNGIANVDIDVTAGPGVDLDLYQDVTGPDGTFAVTMPMIAGLYDVTFFPPAGSPYFEEIQTGVFLASDSNLGTVTLAAARTLSGVVVDELGVGIPQIDLQISDPVTGQELDVAGDDTDINGAFSVVIPEGIWDIELRQVLFQGPLYVGVIFESLLVDQDIVLPTVTLLDGVTLTGIVQRATGEPVLGADLDVFDEFGLPVHTNGDSTNLAGAFSIVVPAGPLTLEVDPPLGDPLVPQLVPFTVAPPPAVNDTGVIALPAGVFVTGTTVDAAQQPVAGVDLDFLVTATQLPIVTVHDNADDLGLFSITVEPEVYDIRFKPGFSTGLAPVLLPAVDASLDTPLGAVSLPEGAALTGTVTEFGIPQAGFEVTLADAATGAPVYVFSNGTDLDGNYAVRVVPGTYDVLFTPPPGSTLAPYLELSVDVLEDFELGVHYGSAPFIRGDSNFNGGVNLGDVVTTLNGIYGLGPIDCLDRSDVNDDGSLNLADPIYTLIYLFQGGPPPEPPFPAEGTDPTTDTLACP